VANRYCDKSLVIQTSYYVNYSVRWCVPLI